jgi:hypothetical protein
LGIFDEGSPGLINSHAVGLWTGSGTLLDSVIVTNSANPIASTSGFGRWLEVDITPITLNPGSYILGAGYLDVDTHAEDKIVFVASETSVPGVTYDHWAFAGGGDNVTLVFPNGNFGGSPGSASLFGPMAFIGATAVPEPATLGLFIFASSILLWRYRLQRRASR